MSCGTDYVLSLNVTAPDRLKNIKIFLEGTETCGLHRRSTAREKEVTNAVLMENFSYLTLTTFCVDDTFPFLLRSSGGWGHVHSADPFSSYQTLYLIQLEGLCRQFRIA